MIMLRGGCGRRRTGRAGGVDGGGNDLGSGCDGD